MATALRASPIAAIHTSPLQRARETADILGARLGLLPIAELGLEEIDFGAWSDARFSDLEGQPGWRPFNEFRSWAAVPGGEAMLAAQARAVATLRTLAARGAGELVLVSHGDIIKSILALALGMPLDLLRRLEIAPASRSVLRLGDHDAVVEAVNLPA